MQDMFVVVFVHVFMCGSKVRGLEYYRVNTVVRHYLKLQLSVGLAILLIPPDYFLVHFTLCLYCGIFV